MTESLEELEARLRRAWTAQASPVEYAAAKAAACRPVPAQVPVMPDAHTLTEADYARQLARVGYRRRAL